MNISCPNCRSLTIRKNGSIHNGKQKYQCLSCLKQFVKDPENKTIPKDTKDRIRRSLLERVSLEGICRIFDISMTWLVMHSQTRQILAFHVGKRNKESGEALMVKLPTDLKKKPTFLQINSLLITKLSPGHNIAPSVKNLERQVTLKDLTARLDNDVQD